MSETYRILFVCMGNICRSPAAEAVMQAKLDQSNLSTSVVLDSAGTIDYHSGNPADARMCRAAAKRGYEVTSRARQVVAEDFKRFDLILAMDQANFYDLSEYDGPATVALFGKHCLGKAIDIPDPYYGGSGGFERVLDLLETGCEHLLQTLKASRR